MWHELYAATSLEYFFESFGFRLENAHLRGTSHDVDFLYDLTDIFNTAGRVTDLSIRKNCIITCVDNVNVNMC